jgi:hypothetical protein
VEELLRAVVNRWVAENALQPLVASDLRAWLEARDWRVTHCEICGGHIDVAAAPRLSQVTFTLCETAD